MGTDGPLISLSHVSLRYGDVCALDDVSLDIADGERICVLGANGSGKSTLASVLAGLLAPDEGEVTLLREQVIGPEGIDYDAYRRVRRGLGLVFQNPDDQIVTSIVEEDVAFGPENLGLSPEEIGLRVERELHRVALTDYAQADPTRLSGGQKQRVAIAGALAMEPRVLVLDEPGALLDVRGRRSILRVMARLHQTGVGIVHVTHFMDEALEADRVVVLDKGRIALVGSPQEVFGHADVLAGLGLAEPFVALLAEALRSLGTDVPWTCDADELRTSILARALPAENTAQGSPTADAYSVASPARTQSTLAARPVSGSTPSTTPAIRASGLSYSYGEADARAARRGALDDISFSIEPGSSCAIVGQTGSGKSTLLRLLCALEVPDAGTLVIDGRDTADRRRRRLLHGRVGYVMQHPERQLFAETVWEDVAFGPRNLGLAVQEVEQRCHEALAMVGLLDREGTSPFHLSGGQQRLCAIAGILAMRPTILVLDEPTAGLDPHGRAQLHDILRRIHEAGTTIVQVTHSMTDAARCEQILVLDEGRLRLQGRPEEVFCDAHVDELHAIGLGIPDALAWALELEEAGVPMLGRPLTLDALADALSRACADADETVEVEHGI